MFVPVKAQEEKEETPLGKQMESMNDAYKAFRKRGWERWPSG